MNTMPQLRLNHAAMQVVLASSFHGTCVGTSKRDCYESHLQSVGVLSAARDSITRIHSSPIQDSRLFTDLWLIYYHGSTNSTFKRANWIGRNVFKFSLLLFYIINLQANNHWQPHINSREIQWQFSKKFIHTSSLGKFFYPNSFTQTRSSCRYIIF